MFEAGTSEERVVRVESCASKVSNRVVLVTGSRIVAQRSSWGSSGASPPVSVGWDVRGTPPSSVSWSRSAEVVGSADTASACARDSVCWYSWSVRQRWKILSASSRRGRGSIGSVSEKVLGRAESSASTKLVRIWAVLLVGVKSVVLIDNGYL